MAFFNKRERYVYVQGIRAGNKGKKPFTKGHKRNVKSPETKPNNSSVGYGSFDTDDFFQASLKKFYG